MPPDLDGGRDPVRHPPATPDELHGWIRGCLGFDIPRRPVVPGHDAPFDYVEHAFFEDRQPRDCLVWASRGGGKTQLGAIVTLADLLFKPGIQVRILGGSFDQSRRMYAHLRALLAIDEIAPFVDGPITARGVRLTNGAAVEILSQSQPSVRGQRVHKLRCDEVELFDADIWSAAQMVTRSGCCGDVNVRAAIEGLSTMHRPFGLMQRLVREAAAAGRRVFRWNVIDVLRRCPRERPCGPCPLLEACDGRAKDAAGFFDIDDAIQQQRRVGAETWEAEMLCGRPSRADSVYSSFDPAVHVAEIEPDPRGTWVAGIDFGYRAPTVMLWAQVTEEDELLVLDELVVRERTAGEIIDLASARAWPRPAWIGADPAGHQCNEHTGLTTIGLWRRAGWPVRALRLALHAGIGAVQHRLRRGDGSSGLRIHPRCRTLVESLTLYRYPPARPEATAPEKTGHDHAADALRYLVIALDRHGAPARWREY